MIRLATLWLFVFAATLALLLLTARAYDYEQSASRVVVTYRSSGIL